MRCLTAGCEVQRRAGRHAPIANAGDAFAKPAVSRGVSAVRISAAGFPAKRTNRAEYPADSRNYLPAPTVDPNGNFAQRQFFAIFSFAAQRPRRECVI